MARRVEARAARDFAAAGASVVLHSPPSPRPVADEHAAEADGYVREKVEITDETYGGQVPFPDLLAAITQHDDAGVIRDIELGADRVDQFREAAQIAALADRPPPNLECVHMTSCLQHGDRLGWYVFGDCEPLFDLPLRSLILQGSYFDLGYAHAPTLEHLELRILDLRKRDLAALFASELPSVTTLKLYLGPGTTEMNEVPESERLEVEDLAPLLDGRAFPNVKHLGLQNSYWADSICFALVDSPILKRLSRLDLSRGALSDQGAAHIAANKEQFSHLDELDVTNNWLSPDGCTSVKGVAKRVLDHGHRTQWSVYHPE
ncbi:MAG: hypothetical protein HOW73_44015 [Polyangiaceae bacterium]|nr:hypothetical protein [Polyangiaceae bacterium]